MNKELFTFEQLSCTVSLPWSSTHYHIILLIQDPCWYTTQMIETTHNPCEPDVTSRRAGAGQSCTLHTPCRALASARPDNAMLYNRDQFENVLLSCTNSETLLYMCWGHGHGVYLPGLNFTFISPISIIYWCQGTCGVGWESQMSVV